MTEDASKDRFSSDFNKVLLVPGTWAETKEGGWTHPKSLFYEDLLRFGFQGIETPKTYFGNKALKRYEASVSIKNYIENLSSTCRLLIIAHSHAGNAVLRALSDSTLLDRKITTITLSTPFIQIYSVKPRFSQFEIMLFTAIFLLCLYVIKVNSSTVGIDLLLLLIAISATAFMCFKLFLNPGESPDNLSNRARRFINYINYEPVNHKKSELLVIRGIGDEAGVAIGFGFALATIIRWFSIVFDKYSRFIVISSFAIGATMALHKTYKLPSPQFYYDLFGFSFVFGSGLLILLYALTRLSVYATVLANAPFGFDLMFGLYGCEIDVSTTPNGEDFKVITLSPADQGQDVRYDHLRHAIYDHPKCVETIVNWIKSNEKT